MGPIYNNEGVLKVQGGMMTVIFSSDENVKQFEVVKQELDSQGIHGTTKYRNSIITGSAFGYVSDVLGKSPRATVNMIDLATGKVITKEELATKGRMKIVEELQSAKSNTFGELKKRVSSRSKAPAMDAEAKGGNFGYFEIPDLTTLEGGMRGFVGLTTDGRMINYGMDSGAGVGRRTKDIRVKTFATEEDMLNFREEQFGRTRPIYSSDDVPSMKY